MVDGLADHALTHNRPVKIREERQKRSAINKLFFKGEEKKKTPKTGLLSDMASCLTQAYKLRV